RLQGDWSSDVCSSDLGFDSLIARSLSLRPSRPCRRFPSRSILGSARNDGSPERYSPIRYLNFASARKLVQLDDGNAAARIVAQRSEERRVGKECRAWL